MKIRRPERRDIDDPRRLLDLLRALSEGVNRSESLTGGPGVIVQRSAGGVSISVGRDHSVGRRSNADTEDCTGGDRVTIAEGGTTLWEREDDVPGEVSVMLDADYDPATYRLTQNMLLIQWDRCGKLETIQVVAESTLITEAEPCPA